MFACVFFTAVYFLVVRSVAPLHDCMMNDLRGKRSQVVVIPMSA